MFTSNTTHPNLLYSDFTPKPCAFCKNLCCNLYFIYHQLEFFFLKTPDGNSDNTWSGSLHQHLCYTFQWAVFKSLSLFDHSQLGELSRSVILAQWCLHCSFNFFILFFLSGTFLLCLPSSFPLLYLRQL